MTGKKFLNSLANDSSDVIQLFLDELKKLKIDYCVIGGLAVNAYAEPVASLDIDLVLAVDDIERLLKQISVPVGGFSVSKFTNSINLQHPDSDLRIQIQTDERYQSFIKNSSVKNVLGYQMKVASIENLLMGKIWAYSDEERRKSKRQKDLADIMRLVETHPHLYELLPENIKLLLN
ncbi:MAG TPA: nucleotidyl transferase AbiEii/AbiGii toxin family protein [Ignavibacteriaceae bacterium]|nr:nucleotidyl transferase AbiEii/AbiGii toxin family protein [Ignavibacteriaceae bacterium]